MPIIDHLIILQQESMSVEAEPCCCPPFLMALDSHLGSTLFCAALENVPRLNPVNRANGVHKLAELCL